MSETVTTAIAPYALPITLAEMKNHLRVELSSTEDDASLLAWIAAACEVVEAGTGANMERQKVLVATSFDMQLEEFGDCIEVPRVPLISVTSITYVDTSGVTQTLSSALYSVNTAEGEIVPTYGQVWPATRGYESDRITVRFIAGLMAPFTAATSDILTISGRSFSVGDRVRLVNSGGILPTGLAANTDYFAIAGPKLSLTSGGAAVDVVGTGSGTHYIGVDVAAFETLKSAIKLLVGHWYEHREAVVIGDSAAPMPMAVEALIASQLAA